MKRYAVILAGGVGERLWPKSRASQPKHLQPIIGERTMIQQTVDRLEGLVPPERICVVTAEAQRALVLEQLPELDPRNVFGEPVGRNTAPAIALAAAALSGREANATMIVLSADHVVRDLDVFRRTLADCCTAAEATGGLVTIGIVPTRPETGYGYIHRGADAEMKCKTKIYAVESFVEKPDERTAGRYVALGKYAWNSGMFVWTVSAICAAFGSRQTSSTSCAWRRLMLSRASATQSWAFLQASSMRELSQTASAACSWISAISIPPRPDCPTTFPRQRNWTSTW